jgi:hypothetical protein
MICIIDLISLGRLHFLKNAILFVLAFHMALAGRAFL